MKPARLRILGFFVASLVMVLGQGSPVSQLLVAAEAEAQATAAARLLGISEPDIERAWVGHLTFRTLGIVVTQVKAARRSGEEIGAAFDEAGHPVDVAALRSLEIAARATVPLARIQPDLLERMRRTPAEEPIRIVAWLRYDSTVLDAYRAAVLLEADIIDPETAREAEAAVTQHAMDRNAAVVEPFVQTVRAMGIPLRYVSTTAPAVFLDATPSQLVTLDNLPAVDTLYLERLDRQDTDIDANETHRTSRVHDFGVRGRDIRVAMLENNGVDPACPWLNVSGWFNPQNPNPDDHVHGTSGCVASRKPDRLGAAPDVELYSANAASYGDADVTAAADWIVTTNVDVTNMSFGGGYAGAEQFLDRYFDYQVRTYSDSYVASAGNDGLGTPVHSPGTARNVLTVGSFDNNDDGDWVGDAMSAFSSSADPANGCSKPNVAAVGNTVDTLGDSVVGPMAGGCGGLNQPAAWLIDNYCGTSFSSPYAAGNLADAMVASSSLIIYPEAASALMMATAWHNIQGSSALSAQDGAGGIHGLAAYRAAAAGRIKIGNFFPNSFTNNGYYTYNIHLQGGDRTRVCLCWSANAAAGYATTSLDADLDLAIYAGQDQVSGTSFGSSASIFSNFEIVEFTPPDTGWYTVRVNDFTFNGASEPYGIAWSQKYADGASARLREYTTESSPLAGPTIGQPAYYMDLECPNSPSSIFLAYPSALRLDGVALSEQTWLPLDIDIWTTLWLDNAVSGAWFWTGWAGTLDASGRSYSNRMALPDWAPLVGFPLHHAALTFDPLAPNDGIKEVTEVHSFEFWPAAVEKTRSDDGAFVQPLPFGFSFYGVPYTECYVNMNGSVTFGGPDNDWTESSPEMLSQEPRIAGLWDDLGPHQESVQGTPRVQVREILQGLSAVVIEFINVPERTSINSSVVGTGANTFRITLHDDDAITLEYRDCSAQDGLAGISPGNGLSAASEKNLTSSGRILSGPGQALYEVFTGVGNAQDLSHPTFWYNKLRFVPTTPGGTNYRLEVDVE